MRPSSQWRCDVHAGHGDGLFADLGDLRVPGHRNSSDGGDRFCRDVSLE